MIKYRIEVWWYFFAFSGWKGTKAQNDHKLSAAGHVDRTLIGESVSEEANCCKFVKGFLRREKNVEERCSQRWELPICISSPTLWQIRNTQVKSSKFLSTALLLFIWKMSWYFQVFSVPHVWCLRINSIFIVSHLIQRTIL